MKFRPWTIRWMMNIFPPLLFNRVSVRNISPDFRTLQVRIRRSLLNKNFERTIFGGSIFSAADPFYAVMYWQYFAHKGIKTQAWLKSATIDYLKPAKTHLRMNFFLTEEDVQEAEKMLREGGRFQKWHTVEAISTTGEKVAEIKTLVYLRLIVSQDDPKPGI